MSLLPPELPLIDARACTTCGDCLRICPTQCLIVMHRVPVVTVDQACIRCRACSDVCSADAVRWALIRF